MFSCCDHQSCEKKGTIRVRCIDRKSWDAKAGNRRRILAVAICTAAVGEKGEQPLFFLYKCGLDANELFSHPSSPMHPQERAQRNWFLFNKTQKINIAESRNKIKFCHVHSKGLQRKKTLKIFTTAIWVKKRHDKELELGKQD